jgi:hypothetical protein
MIVIPVMVRVVNVLTGPSGRAAARNLRCTCSVSQLCLCECSVLMAHSIRSTET